MSKAIIHNLKTTISGGAIIIAAFSILSKLAGLVRDRLIAGQFGASDATDIYFASFRLPDLIFNTLILGAFGSAFIPIFVKHLQKDKNDAFRIANSVLNIIVVILAFLVFAFFIFTPKIVPIITPGFSFEKQQAVVELTRIMLLSIIFFGASNVLGGILNSFKKFVIYSAAPIFYNFGIIIGILFFVPLFGLRGLAFGVVLGALLHFLVQIPSVIKAGYHFQWIFDFKNKAVRKIGALMLPRTLGLAVNQVNQIVINVIASTLASGSIAVFNFAFNLESFPIGIFAVSLAVASFPYFSESAAKKDQEEFVVRFSMTLRRILFLIIPASVLILLLRAQIVRLALGTGNFDWEDTVMTLNTVGYFSISLFAQAMIPLLARAFYAFEDTITPVIIGLFAVLINIFCGIYFSKFMGVAGLALAFSISSIFNAVLLFVILHTRLRWLDEKNILISLLKISFLCVVMGAAVQSSKALVGSFADMHTFFGVLIQFTVSAGVGILVYILLGFLCRCEEVRAIRQFRDTRHT